MATPPALGQYSTTPVFNTKAVARETEVPADTFRAWERRYGVPRPQRTAGGHRLYSERDIAIIRWLRDRTAEGMNISQAVALLNVSLQAAPEPQAPLGDPKSLQQSAQNLVAALINFDTPRADQVLSEAFSLHQFEDVVLNIIQPAMIEIGELWHRGEINVATEHFSTQFIRRKLSGMLNMFEGRPGRQRILVACAPDEEHELGILVAALFMSRRGWSVVYLGPQVPLNDLLVAIRETDPDVVCLSASMPDTALQVAEAIEAINEQYPDLRVGYGGRVFNFDPELREAMPGLFLGQDARELVDSVAELLARGSTSTIELGS